MEATAPASGWTDPERGEHVFSVRVYFEDTDAAGIVYYVNYLKFAERARTEMLRLLGTEQSAMRAEEGIVFIVRHCEIDYLAPARLDDALDVCSRIQVVRGASVRLAQTIRRGGTDLVRLEVKIGCADRNGRAVRLPEGLREALSARADTE